MVVEGSLHRRLEEICFRRRKKIFLLQKENIASLLSSCINLSSGGRWKDEDVGGGGVLGRGQGASCRVPSEPLVRRELLVHHAQHLEEDVAIRS